MMENVGNQTDRDVNAGYTAPPPRTRRRGLPYFAAALLVLTLCGGGYFALQATLTPLVSDREDTEEQSDPPASPLDGEYRKWERPQLAIVVSGQMHGYTQPCGCSVPQYGGLIRRYNFIESLRAGMGMKAGWDVIGVDLGELPQLQGIHAQSMLKFDLSMKALATMNYRAVGIGKYEILSPLGEALAQTYDGARPMPRLLAMSLAQTAPGQLYHGLNVRPYEIVKDTSPKVGIISMLGPDLRDQLKKNEKFQSNQGELQKALDAFADAGVEMGIILHHEYPEVEGVGIERMLAVEKKRKAMARECAQFCADARKKNPKIPAIAFMIILTDEPEPPSAMHQLDDHLPTHVIEIGHKGKYVGLVGVYRQGKNYRMQYQIVAMGPEWHTKKGAEAKQPVIQLYENYNLELKRQNMFVRSPRSPHINQLPGANAKGLKATYVGSQRCGECHDHAYKVWEESRHAKAFKTLEDVRHPSNHHYDPECITCHTVGFKHPGGYHDPVDAATWPTPLADEVLAAKLEKHNHKLRGVGCESCHGPCSEHEKDPDNAALYPLINPYRPTNQERAAEKAKDQASFKQLFNKRMLALEQFCTKCHDHENDVHWSKPGSEMIDKWIRSGIVHRTPPPNNAANTPGELKIDPAKTGVPLLPEIRIDVEKQ